MTKQREVTVKGRPNKPEGEVGAQMLARMNDSHGPLTRWALSHLAFKADDRVLDVGCGGGACLQCMAEQVTGGHLTGVDYSDVSVAKATAYNQEAVDAGRMDIVAGSVSALPFEDDHFDKIVTIESYYFWPALETDVREVRRVLKPDGHFLLVAEIYDHPGLPQPVLDNIAEYQMRNLSLDGFADLFKIAGFADLSIHVEPEHQWICAEGVK